MLTLAIRCVIIFIIVLFICRLMGKSQLSELQPFEFVITLIIADLATIPMAEINIPLVHGIVPLLTLSLLHFLISALARKSIFARKMLNGKPIIVISPNGIILENLKRLNMNLDDLTEAMREANYFSFEDIRYGIIETNGKLSILPKSQSTPITSQDLKIKKQENYLYKTIVSCGKIINDSLKEFDLDKTKILELLNQNGIQNLKDVVIMSIDEMGNVFLQQKNKSPTSIKSKYRSNTQ